MRKLVVLALIASGAFFALCRTSVPSGEEYVPRLTIGLDVCDYRIFIKKCLVENQPYRPVAMRALDACYPPIAYCLAKCFPLTPRGEVAYVSFLFGGLMAGLVFFLLQRRLEHVPSFICSVLLTIPYVSGPLRGNPAAWAAGSLFVFLAWFDSPRMWKRMVAAAALGFATSLKITPVVYGLLYLKDNPLDPDKWPKEEMMIAGLSFAMFFAVPFVLFGGPNSVDAWFANALANSRYYSPLADYGFAPIVRCFGDLLPRRSLSLAVQLTNLLAVALCLASCFARQFQRALTLLGVAMVFLCHHDYGLVYLLPAFACWIGEKRPDGATGLAGNARLLVESALWFLVFESAICVPSIRMLVLNEQIVSNGAIILLGLLSLADVGVVLVNPPGGRVKTPGVSGQTTRWFGSNPLGVRVKTVIASLKKSLG